MKDYFSPAMPHEAVNAISSLGLAHVGDAVYELLVRTWLCAHGRLTSRGLHRETVALVRAPAQAKAMARLLPQLSEAETAVYKRARNARVNSVPKGAALGEYHAATGMEALFGWLYLTGQQDRMHDLFVLAMGEGAESDAP